ncbi:MAG: hypothetical protein AAF387_21615 [Pseudomonadota bacterium]
MTDISEVIDSGVERLNLFDVQRLDFEPPDVTRFPLLNIARAAIERGGTATTVMNAANEVLVAAFLERQIRFTDIPVLIEETLSRAVIHAAGSIDEILSADQSARHIALEQIKSRAA